MLKSKWKDKIPCREIRAKRNIKEVVKFAAKQKWKWAGHVARLKGITWGRDAGQRDDWRRDAEGSILQWMDRASM